VHASYRVPCRSRFRDEVTGVVEVFGDAGSHCLEQMIDPVGRVADQAAGEHDD
jgi:hypothetical protein